MRKRDWVACFLYRAIMVTPYFGVWAMYVVVFLVMPTTLLAARPFASLLGSDARMALAILAGALMLACPVRALAIVAERALAQRRVLGLLKMLAIWTLVALATLYGSYVGQTTSTM